MFSGDCPFPWGLPEGGKLLILGGGQVGAALARSDGGPERCVITHRSAEKVRASLASGLQALEFRLDDESTWDSLPSAGDGRVAATLITFELSWAADGASLGKLWPRLGGSVLLLATTSVYGGISDHRSTVTEESPLTGVGVTGRPLEDRGRAETWAMEQGATILTLSGISTGNDAGMRMFFEAGYVRHVYGVINYVHMLDIVSITRLMLDGRGSGQRFNLSSGAYRWRDLGEALGFEGLAALPGHPEHPPPNARSKIVSVAKLTALLKQSLGGAGTYRWRSPVAAKPDLEPASRGLPTADEDGGAGHDRQWELFQGNFEGCWHGRALRFGRSSDTGAPSLAGAPVVQPASTVHVSFQDHDTGTWRDGEEALPLGRAAYNASRDHVQFPGVGARAPPDPGSLAPADHLSAEVSFFTERARTVLAARYRPGASSGDGPGGQGGASWTLDSASVAPLRCKLGSDFPCRDEAVPLGELLRQAAGWGGTRQAFGPARAPTGDEAAASLAALPPFDPERLLALESDGAWCVGSSLDGSFFALPGQVRSEGAEMKFGCLHAPPSGRRRLRVATLSYRGGGDAEWSLEEYSP